jgi:hypothetical protein
MTKVELKGAIKDWWDYNNGQAQGAEGRYFMEQVVRESKHGKDFEAVSAKDVSEGLSVKVKSGNTIVSGILYKNGEFVERGDSTDWTSVSARIDG